MHQQRAPHYFGSPGDSLADLGALIAQDPRFSLCAARRAQLELVTADDKVGAGG